MAVTLYNFVYRSGARANAPVVAFYTCATVGEITGTPTPGDLAFEQTTGALKEFYNSAWQVISAGGGGGPALTPHHTTHETGGTDAISVLSASILTSGTLADARLTSNVPLLSSANVFNASQTVVGTLTASSLGTTPLDATRLTGTIADARLSTNVPLLDKANTFSAVNTFSAGLDGTPLNASQLTSGTIPNAAFPATLPATSGVNLTSLNATQLTSGTVPDARLSINVQMKPLTETYATIGTEAGLPNSRRLIAGANITFDTSAAGQIIINSAGAGGGGTGDVTGPSSAVNNDLAVFNGTTGKTIKDSGILSTNLALLNASNVFTQNQTISIMDASILLNDPTRAVDARLFTIANSAGSLYFIARNDANTVNQSIPLKLDRTGNVTVGGNVLISKTVPEFQLQYLGNTSKTRLFEATPSNTCFTNNLSYDGTNWNRDDTSKGGGLLQMLPDGRFYVHRVAAGANPVGAGLNTSLYLDVSGNTTFYGNVLISKTRPELQFLTSGDTTKGRILTAVPGGRIDITSNLTYNGTNWIRDDPSKPAGLATFFESGRFGVWSIAAGGAEPATIVYGFDTQPGGNTINYGTLQVNGVLTANSRLSVSPSIYAQPSVPFAVSGYYGNFTLTESSATIASFVSNTSVHLDIGSSAGTVMGVNYPIWLQSKVNGQGAPYGLILQPLGGGCVIGTSLQITGLVDFAYGTKHQYSYIGASGGALTIDPNTRSFFVSYLDQNITAFNFNGVDTNRNYQIVWIIRQDGTGGRTVSWGGNYTILPQSNFSVPTPAWSISVLVFTYWSYFNLWTVSPAFT